MQKTTSFVVVGEKNTVRVQGVIATKAYNVVDYRWVLECVERKTYEFPAMQHVSERLRDRDRERGVGGGGSSWWRLLEMCGC